MNTKTVSATAVLPVVALLTLSACGDASTDRNSIGEALADDFVEALSTGNAELASDVACPPIAEQMEQVVALAGMEDIDGMSIDEYGEATPTNGEDSGDDAFSYPIEFTTRYNDDSDDFSESLTLEVEKVEGDWCIANLS